MYRSGRNRLFLINLKYIKIAGVVLAVALIAAVAIILISQGRERAEVEAAVGSVADKGVINIGLRGDIGPLCSYDEQMKTYSGLEKEIADELVKRLYPDGILVNYVQVNSKTKDAFLQTGKADITLGASVKGSVKGIKYTSAYFSDGTAYLVIMDAVMSEDGLSGGAIGVVQGTLPATKAKSSDKKIRLETYLEGRGIDAEVRSFASYPEAVEALRLGHVQAVCANETFLKLYGKSGMLILPERFMPVGFCVQVSDEHGRFYDAVQKALSDMKSDGTIELLLNKWELTDYAYLEG